MQGNQENPPSGAPRPESWVTRWIPRFIKANHITFFRLSCVPGLVVLGLNGNGHPGWFFVVGLISGFSDFFDGQVARARGQESELGAFLDPLGDKLLFGAAWVVYWYQGWVSATLLVCLLALETHALILPLVIILRRLIKKMPLWPPPKTEPNQWGKWKTGWVVGAMGLVVLGLGLDASWLHGTAEYLLWGGLAFGALAYVTYFLDYFQGEFI